MYKYVIINDNIPFFDEDDMTTKSYEMFSELDELGRCGVVHASIGKDLMPTEEKNDGLEKISGTVCVDKLPQQSLCSRWNYQ